MDEKVLCKKSDLVAIADALREMTDSTETFTINELKTATVQVISLSSPTLQTKTVYPLTTKQTIIPDEEYMGLSSVIIEAIPIIPQSIPEITISSTGLITATIIQNEGYVSGGTKSSTMQLAFAEDSVY